MRTPYTSVGLCILLLNACTSSPNTSKTEVAATTENSKADASIYEQQNKWSGACQHSDSPTQRQSPIALVDSLFPKKPSSPIKFNYKAADAEIVNNGHTIQYRFKSDAGYLELEGSRYLLKQFHFHKTSEHTLNGKAFDMEVHFVHMKEAKGKDSKPAAVALGFLVASGKSTEEWNKTWNSLPAKAASKEAKAHGESAAHQETILETAKNLNARSLIPAKSSYLVYEGSLTTPGCDEIVTHAVADKAIAFNQSQIDKFASYMAISNRKIQPLGDAKIRRYRKVSER